MGLVDIGVLVSQTVARIVNHVFNVHGQFVNALNARVLRGHLGTVINGVGE